MKLTTQLLAGTSLFFAFSSGYAQTQIQTNNDGKQTSGIQSEAPLSATDDEWHFSITPYLWIPAPSATIHMPINVGGHQHDANISANSNWWDILNKLSSNFLVLSADGRVEVSKGHWGAFVDGYWMYAKVTENNDGSKFLLHDAVDVTDSLHIVNKFEAGQVNFGPRYLIGDVPFDKSGAYGVAFEAYGGGRVNWVGDSVDGSVNLNHVGVGFNGSRSEAYAEPMIGLKTTWNLGPDFKAMIRGDIGGWGLVENDNVDCDLEAGIGWQFAKHTYLDLAYRARGQWQNESSNQVTVNGWFHGPNLA